MSVRRRRERPAGGGKPGWLINFRHPNAPKGRFYRTVSGELAKRDAEKLERRFRDELDEDGRRERSPLTVRQALNRYWQEHGRHLASWRSERAYIDALDAALGGDSRTLISVTAADVAEAVAMWRSTPETLAGRKTPRLLKPSSINRRLSCLQRIWSRAEDLWTLRLARIPWRRLKLDEPEPADRSLTMQQRRAFLAVLSDRSRPIVLMALMTGLRRGALLRLEVRDLDFERRVIHATSKGRAGGKQTPVPITDEIAALLGGMTMPEVGKVFAVTPQELRRDIDKAREASGLPGATLHAFRHSLAQDLEDLGLGDFITDALHHADPRLRRRYARVRAERLRQGFAEVNSRRRLD